MNKELNKSLTNYFNDNTDCVELIAKQTLENASIRKKNAQGQETEVIEIVSKKMPLWPSLLSQTFSASQKTALRPDQIYCIYTKNEGEITGKAYNLKNEVVIENL